MAPKSAARIVGTLFDDDDDADDDDDDLLDDDDEEEGLRDGKSENRQISVSAPRGVVLGGGMGRTLRILRARSNSRWMSCRGRI